MKPSFTLSLFLILSILLFSCAFAPVNNQYEKAGTLKKGNLELSGNVTGYSFTGGGEIAGSNNNIGFRAGYGITDRFDLKIRYERLMPGSGFDAEDFTDGDEIKGVNYFSIVPKFALVPGSLSLLVPLSHYSFKEKIDSQETISSFNSIAPQLIYTWTNEKNKVDLSFGLKADGLFGSNGGGGVLLGTTIGAGFSSDLNKWAIRPEIGASFLGGGAFLSYGIGFQFIIPKNKK